MASTLANTSPFGVVDEALMAEMQLHFSDAQIIELCILIAVLVGMAKMLFALDLADREDYCPLPPRDA